MYPELYIYIYIYTYILIIKLNHKRKPKFHKELIFDGLNNSTNKLSTGLNINVIIEI